MARCENVVIEVRSKRVRARAKTNCRKTNWVVRFSAKKKGQYEKKVLVFLSGDRITTKLSVKAPGNSTGRLKSNVLIELSDKKRLTTPRVELGISAKTK